MRVFSSKLPPLQRRLYRLAVAYFVAVFFSSMWPIYPIFSRIEPMVLGMPFSLVYLIVLLALSFFVLLGIYLWQARNGELD